MSPCTELVRHCRTTVPSLAVLLSAYYCAQAATAGEKPIQNGTTWVLHKPHNDLADGYDPRRDAEKDLATAGEVARKSNRNIFVVVGGDWCSWCHTLDRFFHEHTDIEALRDKTMWL